MDGLLSTGPTPSSLNRNSKKNKTDNSTISITQMNRRVVFYRFPKFSITEVVVVTIGYKH